MQRVIQKFKTCPCTAKLKKLSFTATYTLQAGNLETGKDIDLKWSNRNTTHACVSITLEDFTVAYIHYPDLAILPQPFKCNLIICNICLDKLQKEFIIIPVTWIR